MTRSVFVSPEQSLSCSLYGELATKSVLCLLMTSSAFASGKRSSARTAMVATRWYNRMGSLSVVRLSLAGLCALDGDALSLRCGLQRDLRALLRRQVDDLDTLARAASVAARRDGHRNREEQ